MKVKRIQQVADAIKYDGSRASLLKIRKFHQNFDKYEDHITLTTLDATYRLDIGDWFVKEANGRVGGYTEEKFNSLFEFAPTIIPPALPKEEK